MNFLRENLRTNNVSNVVTAQAAIGSQFGWAGISDFRGDSVNRVTRRDGAIVVPTLRLDAFVEEKEIALLKIDTEGSEKFVLDGLSNLLSRVRFIVFEVQDRQYENFNVTFADVFDLLREHGFVIVEWRNGEVQEVARDAEFPTFRNLLACRDQAALMRRLRHAAAANPR